MGRSSMAPVRRRSNEALASLFGLSGVFFSRATSRLPPKFSFGARTPRLAPLLREVVSWGTPQRIVIVWEGASGKTILQGWRAHLHTAPATTTMHTLNTCVQHGGKHIYSGGGGS